MDLVLYGVLLLLSVTVAACTVQLRSYRRNLELVNGLLTLADSESKAQARQIIELSGRISEKDVLLQKGADAIDTSNRYLVAHQEYIKKQESELEGLRATLEFEQQQYAKLLGQKKSSEVRTGRIAEQVAPFLEGYPLKVETARFIGEPIDFIHFDDDKITFVEVKSGKSQLSPKQRQIRELIKEGKVDFILHRIEGNDDSGTN